MLENRQERERGLYGIAFAAVGIFLVLDGEHVGGILEDIPLGFLCFLVYIWQSEAIYLRFLE